MSRDSLTEHQTQHDTALRSSISGAIADEQGLPGELRARVRMLGPGDAAALGDLLIAFPSLSSKILALASPQVGLAAVQRAIRATAQRGAAVDGESEAGTGAAAAGELPPLEVARARTYNRAHSRFAAAFDAATDHACVGADGELDPIAVWRWQSAHGILADGRVGPQTSAAARAAKQPAREAVASPQPVDDIPAERTPGVKPQPVDDIPAERTPSASPQPADDIPAERTPGASPQPVAGGPAPRDAQDPGPATRDGAGAGSAGPDAPAPTATLNPPARADTGGPGSLARRVLAAHGAADEAFRYLVSDNDAVLDKNLADYGSVAEQRALLDAVIAAGADVVHVRRAFHACWHVALAGVAATPTQAARDWPISNLQAIHRQLQLLPDHDARAGAWKTLSWTRTQNGAARGWWDKGDFSIGTDAWNRTDIQRANGYFEVLAAPAAAGDPRLHVRGGERLKVGDPVSIDDGKASHETGAVKSVDGATYTLDAALTHDHAINAVVELPQDGRRQMNWLDYTVRHEIAHSLDGGAVDTRGFYALGGWGGGNFKDWAAAMGSDAWKTRDGTVIDGEDRTSIHAGLMSALSAGKSPFDMLRTMDPPHPIMKYEHKEVPVIVAALKALRLGENFYDSPTELHAAGGKRFGYSPVYHQFQYFSEKALTDRVSNYALAAPAEFFAEAYATYYEEAGKPGITEADHGRLIRSAEQRQWLHDHVHERGHAPAGTGAARAAGGEQGQDAELGAQPEGGKRGRAAGVSGL
jgi:hypothetical protein